MGIGLSVGVGLTNVEPIATRFPSGDEPDGVLLTSDEEYFLTSDGEYLEVANG